MTKGLKNVLMVCVIFGIISLIAVELLFFLVLPSGWLYLLIPIIMSFGIRKFARIPREELQDDEQFERLRTRTGWICAGFVLINVLIAAIPVTIALGWASIFMNFIFYLVCILAVYEGYRQGVGVITDAYYKSQSEL